LKCLLGFNDQIGETGIDKNVNDRKSPFPKMSAPNLPDFEAWAIFAKVAALGSYTAAARDLGLSVATVSKAITRLEARLGTALLHRTSRRISLSESGQSALEHASQLLAAGEAIESEIGDEAAVARGRIRLAAPMSFGVLHLAPLIPEFLKAHPGVTIELQLSDARTDLVGEGIDVALRIGTLEDSSLRARRLLDIRRPLVASPAYFERHGRPAHPRELENHQALIYSNMAQPRVWRFTHPLEGSWKVKVSGRLEINNGDAQIPALLAGMGLSPLPEFLIWRELRDGRLEEALPAWSMEPSALYVLTPPSSYRPKRVSALIEFLALSFLRAPWAHRPG
jgi:DNA-binding transcriptional LysR family regulator